MTEDPDTERREPTRIHLLWSGPHTFGDVLEMDGGTDYGIYQVYGPHPASGTESLLYIGQANDQTFAARFTNRDHRWWNPDSDDGVWEDNTALLRFFTGRVHPTQDDQDRGGIDYELWGTYINKAEKLLICAHTPHWNQQGISGIKEEQTDVYDNCHVLNWAPAHRCCRRSPASAMLTRSSSASATIRSKRHRSWPAGSQLGTAATEL